MNCRQCDHMLQRAAAPAESPCSHLVEKSYCDPPRGPRTNSSREKAHISKIHWHLNTVYRDSWCVTLWPCQDTNDYKMADNCRLRTRKDYSSEVFERHGLTMNHEHEEQTEEQTKRKTRQQSCKVTCGKCIGSYSKQQQQQCTNSALHNTEIIIIQMASSAQEPAINCLHGFISFFCLVDTFMWAVT